MANIQANITSDRAAGPDSPIRVTRRRRWLRRAALLSDAAMASMFGFIGAGPIAVQAADPIVAVPRRLTSASVRSPPMPRSLAPV
jgi:hypothetical protein